MSLDNHLKVPLQELGLLLSFNFRSRQLQLDPASPALDTCNLVSVAKDSESYNTILGQVMNGAFGSSHVGLSYHQGALPLEESQDRKEGMPF